MENLLVCPPFFVINVTGSQFFTHTQSWGWLYRKTPEFTHTTNHSFSWGNVVSGLTTFSSHMLTLFPDGTDSVKAWCHLVMFVSARPDWFQGLSQRPVCETRGERVGRSRLLD